MVLEAVIVQIRSDGRRSLTKPVRCMLESNMTIPIERHNPTAVTLAKFCVLL